MLKSLNDSRFPDGTILDRSYDSLGRSPGYVLDPGGSAASQTAYAYLPSSDLLHQTTLEGGAPATPITRTVTYEPHRDLITQIENEITVTSVTSVVSSYTYTNDELGRRTRRDHSGSAFTSPDIINYGYKVTGGYGGGPQGGYGGVTGAALSKLGLRGRPSVNH